MERTVPHLEELMRVSKVREHPRGMRRYFPIASTDVGGVEWLNEAFYIIYGRQPENDGEVGMACFTNGLDRYVEIIDGRLWVRTIYKPYNVKVQKVLDKM